MGSGVARQPARVNTVLAKILHDHDVGLVEFVQAEDKRFAVWRDCQTAKERNWLVQSQDRRELAMSKIKEFNSTATNS